MYQKKLYKVDVDHSINSMQVITGNYFMKVLRYTLVSILIFLLSTEFLRGNVQIDSLSSTETSCEDSFDGTITVYVSGDSGIYNYSLNLGGPVVETSGPTDSAHFTFTGHQQSLFYVILVVEKDTAGNITGVTSTNATIDGPEPISILSAMSTDMGCHDDPAGPSR